MKRNAAVYFGLLSFILINMSDDPEVLLEVVLEITLIMLFVAIALGLNGNSQHFVQVASSVMVCQNVIAVCLVPVMFWLTLSDSTASYVAMFALLFWDFLLLATIFRKVLAINIVAGWIISLLFFAWVYGGAFGIYSLMA